MLGTLGGTGFVGRRILTVIAAIALGAALAAPAQAGQDHGRSRMRHRHELLMPGNLLVSRSAYSTADIQPGVTQLPPGCTAGNCVTATNGGEYPDVFDNDLVDGSFGVTAKIFLDELDPSGSRIGTIRVPSDEMVTSFSSKSELALNRSTDGKDVTFMGYAAPLDGIDVSNSNTPGVIDPTNPVPGAFYRVVAELDRFGRFHFTETNAYSGNNGRAAILNNEANVFYTAGNAGNGSGAQPAGILLAAGAQILSWRFEPESEQSPGEPTPVASFSVSQLGDNADKLGKDDNFRGIGIFNDVLYYTKGSGGNGVNTLYFVDTTGRACPTGGVGLPLPGAALPTAPLPYGPSTLTTTGLPSNICILKGFPTTPAKSSTAFPFGFWFANRRTLYLADEGDGNDTFAGGQYTDAAASQSAGLQKWVYDSEAGKWDLAYTIQSGLGLGQPYTVPGYPTGNNAATGLTWAPATDGLRNITGHVSRDGTATIWAVTSTVSGSGDQGADPNKLVAVSDPVNATTLPGSNNFTTIRTARLSAPGRAPLWGGP
jgi:hypothetical protein